MAEKKLMIDGNEYISSGRAAELVGYTKDYVGQLARGGKINARRVGRNWYIEEASITKHKLSVHYTLTKPKKAKISHKRDTETAEISRFIIDNSETAESTVKEDVHTQNSKNEDTVSRSMTTKVSKEDDDAVDLFPRIQRKQRDPLLHTDIRYEREKYDTDKPDNRRQVEKQAVGSQHGHGFRDVLVRKPTIGAVQRRTPTSGRLRREEDRVSAPKIRHTSQKIGLDGIQVDGRARHEDRTQNGVRLKQKRTTSDFSSEQYPVSRITKQRKHRSFEAGDIATRLYDDTGDAQGEKREELSKAVPVVGAIVLFTVIAVVYIVFTSF